MKYLIRKAEAMDIPVITELLIQLGSPDVTDSLVNDRLQMLEENPLDSIYVYEESNEVLAAIVLRIRENIREISQYMEVVITVVLHKSKRNGIGSRLMEFAEDQAVVQGCKAVYLISGFNRQNEAHLFYKDLGYEITGYRFVKHVQALD